MKPVHQYTREGKYIKSYKSAKEAEVLNLFFSYKNINACCKGSKKTHHNFMFSFDKKENIEPFDRSIKSGAKEVHQYTLEGIYIKSYPSATRAGKELGLKFHSGINCCCTNYKGTVSAYGFKWSHDKV